MNGYVTVKDIFLSSHLYYPFWLAEANFPYGTTNQKHYPDLDKVMRYRHFAGKTTGGGPKCRLFSQAIYMWKCHDDVHILPPALAE